MTSGSNIEWIIFIPDAKGALDKRMSVREYVQVCITACRSTMDANE